jgi:hypothetical protein
MRRATLLYLLPVLAATPVAAQAFEGTAIVKAAPAETVPSKWMFRGHQIAIDGVMPASSGPMAGSTMHIIIDHTAQTATVLIPLTPAVSGMMGSMLPPGSKGIKMVSALPKAAPGATPTPPKNLGTSETIAGTKCDDYEATGSDGSVERMCVTHELGEFTYPSIGGRGGRGGAAPAWVDAMRQIGGFPLKVWSPAGRVDFEIESVQRGSVPASAFEIPEGYNTMGGMGGRGGNF